MGDYKESQTYLRLFSLCVVAKLMTAAAAASKGKGKGEGAHHLRRRFVLIVVDSREATLLHRQPASSLSDSR